MADAITLNADEQRLYDELVVSVEKLHESYASGIFSYEDQNNLYELLKNDAHTLHMALKADGHEPKHHAYMYKNRSVPVEDIEFYNHIHPVEDLLAFVKDPDANNDPEDSTIGVEFSIRLYTNRWGRYDVYSLTRTDTGWKIKGASTFHNTDADKSGNPALFAALEHDFVCYPEQTGELLERIWNKAQQGATREQVQKYLNDFAEWVSTCEKATPAVCYED